MARGITETDVWSACDALLLAGDRPTIERVRQQLGRGSPNTVSPMLDAWFKGLGARISDPGAFAAPPDIPDTVGQAAKHFWEVALAETRRDFDERLREGMAAAIANVEAEKERAAMADAAAYTASAKLTRATAEATELRALLDQERTLRATDLARLDEAKRQIDRLVHEAQATAAAAAEERAQAQRHVETAQARFEAAERRAALESDSERSARAKADKRAEALEQRLEKMLKESRATEARLAEENAGLHVQLARQREELEGQRTARAALQARVEARDKDLAAAHLAAARAEGDVQASHRIVEQFRALLEKSKPPRTRSRASASGER